jgi:hypothetical protein
VAARSDGSNESFQDLARDVVTLVVAYVKQETLGPLRGLGRYIAFGLGAAFVGGLGLVLLLLGLLRLLQHETGDVFSGFFSWVPYTLTLVVAGAFIGLALTATKSPPAKEGM